MNPVLILMGAIKYLEHNTPPRLRTQARLDAADILSSAYKQLVAEHDTAKAAWLEAVTTLESMRERTS